MKQKVKYIFGLARVDELRLLNNCVSHCQILFSLLKEVSGGKRSNISYKFFFKSKYDSGHYQKWCQPPPFFLIVPFSSTHICTWGNNNNKTPCESLMSIKL